MSTEQRFLRSTISAYGSQLGRTLLRLVGDVILARLIAPEDHGLFALAWATVTLAAFVRDVGLPYELVRHPEKPFGSFLVWEITSGLFVTASLVLAAPLFGSLSPDLPRVLRILSFWILIDAVTVVPRVFFERELAVARLVVPELARGLLLAVVSISLGALDFGVWSFVAGELVSGFAFAAMLWFLAHDEIPIALDYRSIPRLIRGSSYLFAIAVVANSNQFVSRYLVEIVDTTAMVGQFEKAYLWATRAHVLIVPALVRALYPTLVAYYDDRKRFVAAYHLGTVGIASVEVLVAYFLFFNAKVVLVDLLLGPSWTEAVALLQILCLLPIIKPFSRLGGEALKARREDRIWLVIAVVNLSCLVGFGWVLSHRLGSAGVAWAHYLMVGDLIMAWRVYLVCGPRFWRIARDLAFLYLAPLPFFLGVAHFFPLPDWPRFAASAVVAAAVAALFLLRFRGPFRAFFHSEATLP